MNTQVDSTLHINSIDAFDQALRDAGRPVVVDFWAPWCGPCKLMGPVLDEFADEHQDGAVVAKVDVDQLPELARRFQIRSIPTIIFFKDGQEAARLSGVTSKSALEQQLNEIA